MNGCLAMCCSPRPSRAKARRVAASTCPRASGSIISAASNMKEANPLFIQLIPKRGPIFRSLSAAAPSCRLKKSSSTSANIPSRAFLWTCFPTAAETSFNYYDDDGITYAYEKGAFFEQRLSDERQWHNRSFRSSCAHGNL